MRKAVVIALAIVFLAAAAMTSGCCPFSGLADKAVEKSVENATKKAIEKETGVTGDVSTEEGKDASGEDIKEVPRYPKTTRTGFFKVAINGGKSALTCVYTSKDDMTKVVEWYKKKMEELGWKETLSTGDDKGQVMSYDKTEASAMVSVRKTDTGSEITLNYTPKTDEQIQSQQPQQ